MNNAHFEELYQGVHMLISQDSSAKTTHRILYGLKKELDAECSVIVLKNPTSDYLEIKNFVNVSCSCAHPYQRPVGTAAIGRLFYTQEFVLVSKLGSKEDYEDLKLDWEYEMVIAARIAVDQQTIGFIALYFDHNFEVDTAMKQFILSEAGLVAEGIRKERLLTLVNQLRRMDDETGLHCHDFFMHRLEEELRKVERYKYPAALAIMDLDNFKEMSSLHGLSVGRELFKEISEELKFSVRGVDIIGLFGVDELILFLPNTTFENARMVLNRYRKKISTSKFTSKSVSTSISIGLTPYNEKDTVKDLVWRAQTALYNARLRQKGGLRTVLEKDVLDDPLEEATSTA